MRICECARGCVCLYVCLCGCSVRMLVCVLVRAFSGVRKCVSARARARARARVRVSICILASRESATDYVR